MDIESMVNGYLYADNQNTITEIHAALRNVPHNDMADNIIAGDEALRPAVLKALAEMLGALDSMAESET